MGPVLGVRDADGIGSAFLADLRTQGPAAGRAPRGVLQADAFFKGTTLAEGGAGGFRGDRLLLRFRAFFFGTGSRTGAGAKP